MILIGAKRVVVHRRRRRAPAETPSPHLTLELNVRMCTSPAAARSCKWRLLIDNGQKGPGMTAGVISIGLVVKTKPLPSAAELRHYCGLKCDDASAARSLGAILSSCVLLTGT